MRTNTGIFLDYFAGAYLDKSSEIYSLTNGGSIAKSRTDRGGEIRKAMDDILEGIIWEEPGKTLSPYYKKLVDIVEKTKKGVYWIERTELFARAFEVYISEELRRLKIVNHLLVHQKYTEAVYLTAAEMKPLKPKFDRLISLIKKAL